MPIAEGIAAAKLATDVTRLTLDLLRNPKPDTEAIRARLIELQDLVLSAKFALSDADDEIRGLKRIIDDHDQLNAIKADLEMDITGRYYLRKSEKQQGLIPYCPICWGKDDKLVPLAVLSQTGNFICALHKTVYIKPDNKIGGPSIHYGEH